MGLLPVYLDLIHVLKGINCMLGWIGSRSDQTVSPTTFQHLVFSSDRLMTGSENHTPVVVGKEGTEVLHERDRGPLVEGHCLWYNPGGSLQGSPYRLFLNTACTRSCMSSPATRARSLLVWRTMCNAEMENYV